MEGFALRDSDTFDEWQSAEREVYQRELAGALERLVREQLAANTWEGAIASGQRWLELDPLHEPAHRSLMEAYARAGEKAAALRQYRDAVAVLDRELGVAPLPETTALNDAILADALTTRPTHQSEAPPLRRPLAGPSALPFIGRTEELERLQAAIVSSTADGRVIVIEGEAGIGKTRLADRFTELASADGHTTVEARCYAGESGIAFAPLVALLRARLASGEGSAVLAGLPPAARAALATLLPELQVSPPESQLNRSRPTARLALLEAIVTVLISDDSSTRPLVIRLDDAQWADASTMQALAFLARRLHERSALLLLSWRREELPDHAAPLVAAARPPTGDTIRLGRLDIDATRQLVTVLAERAGETLPAAAADDLVTESEGLPLYVVEALAASEPTSGVAPAGIRALLQARLAGLSVVATQVVAAASVIGRSFDLEIVRVVSGRSEEETVDALEELVKRGIVRETAMTGSGQHDFVHARLRDVAYDGTSTARRRLLHKRAAEAYRGGLVADPDDLGRLVRLAAHERDAGRSTEAAMSFAEAGGLARKVFANHEALDYLESALVLGHPDPARLHEEMGDILITLGEYPRAIASLVAAAAGAPSDRLAGIEHRLGRIALRRGDPRTAEAHLAAAAAALDAASGGGPPLARVLADRATAAARADELDRAWSLAVEARGLADGDDAARVHVDRTTGLVARERGDLQTARAALERSRSRATEMDDPIACIAASNALAVLAREEGGVDEAIALAEDALATARRTGERHLEAALESNLADALEAAGQRGQAMAHLKASAELYAELGDPSGELEPGVWMLETW